MTTDPREIALQCWKPTPEMADVIAQFARTIRSETIEEAAKVADDEAAEYQRQIDELNRVSSDAFVREGIIAHARRDEAQNIAALLRTRTRTRARPEKG